MIYILSPQKDSIILLYSIKELSINEEIVLSATNLVKELKIILLIHGQHHAMIPHNNAHIPQVV